MRQYFSDLAINDQVTISVVLTAASPRTTRANKPYLVLELFDGRDKLVGNYWDWSGRAIPEVSTQVYLISGQVTEYNGQKQITVSKINTDTETPISDFQPNSGKDMIEVYKEAIEFVSTSIMDEYLLNVTLAALESFKDLWLTVPAAVGVHHAYVGGTLIHSLSVARKAYALAKTVQEANTDLCVAGGMLHDIGKLYAYSMDLTTIRMTRPGKLLEHAYIGASMVADIVLAYVTAKSNEDQLKLELLQHIILSHHGTLDFGAVTEPQCIEAHLVHLADKADATCEMIVAASNKTDEYWTDKVWGLNNRQMVNYKSINDIFKPGVDYVEADDAVVVQ